MECPKCGAEIDKNTVVCPNCKKVLKIACPVCKTLNEKNICKKCGKVLITKCAKCGKTNLIKGEKCPKCGFSNEVSVIKNESNTDDFAVLRIDFSNRDAIKSNFDSNKIFTKFMSKIDSMILQTLKEADLRRQIYDNKIYIIRFNKDYTLKTSVAKAIETVFEIIKTLSKINFKLLKKRNITLKGNFSLFKRNVEDNPYNIDFGFNATMISQAQTEEEKLLESFQIVIDDDFFDYYNEKYSPVALNSVMVNGEMKRFYEIKLKDFIDLKEIIVEEKEENDDIEVPDFVQNILDRQDKLTKDILKKEFILPDEDLFNTQLIEFEDKNCIFSSVESINVLDEVFATLKTVPKGVLAIKASERYQPYTIKLLTSASETNLYDIIIPITCHDDMKFVPYSFFRDLIISVFEYSVSTKNLNKNDFSPFSSVDTENCIKDLITLNTRTMTDINEVRKQYFKAFAAVMQSVPNSLIYIENFEKMDESSMLVLDQLFDLMDEINVSYLISYGSDFSLHKKFKYLIIRKDYTEITLQPTPFNKILKADKDFYKNVEEDFYFQRIEKYACGSVLFLDFVIQYLFELGIYTYSNGSIALANPDTIIIPSSLDNLVQRRLNLLKDNAELLKFLLTLAFTGARIDIATIESFGIENWHEMADTLSNMGYIYEYNNCYYFSNYNLIKRNIIKIIDPEKLREVAINLANSITCEEIPHPLKAQIYDILGEKEKLIEEWERLANLSLSMGDFSTYMNCAREILNCLSKYAQDWTKEDLQQYKLSLFENIAGNIIEYDPLNHRDIAESALRELHRSGKMELYVSLCSKMIFGYLLTGDYKQTLVLIDQVLRVMSSYSMNPSSENFDFNYLLFAILRIKALFQTGVYDDCIKFGYNIINVLDKSKLETIECKGITKEVFNSLLIECIGYIALSISLSLEEDVTEFLTNTMKLLGIVPSEYNIFIQLQHFLLGQPMVLEEFIEGLQPVALTIYHILKAFQDIDKGTEIFVQEIYKAKIVTQETKQYSLELFTDSVIGYVYIQNTSFQKAAYIFKKVLKEAEEKGLSTVTYVTQFIMAKLHLKQRRSDLAYEVLNNAIVAMEKSGHINDYLLMLCKVTIGKILLNSGKEENAQNCFEQALYLKNKHDINIDFEISKETKPENSQNNDSGLEEIQEQ